MEKNIYLYIAVMAGVSYMIRVLPLTLIRKPIKNQFIQSFLYYVPYVTLAVMTFPAILSATNSTVSAALALVIMFVVEMLAPQIQVTVAALTERIPTFIEQTSAKLMQLMDDNPDMKAWIMEVADLESLEWTKILKDSMGFLGNQMSTVMGSAVNVIGSVTSESTVVRKVPRAIACTSPLPSTVWRGRKFWRGRGEESSIP